ncbi:cytochrome c biogenesis heme-transporting ATPase CcmA [Methylomicrobium sp. Wu6]|uniref:cytochrome c biogenesis heme-transporting ATPase CcmA n=1 Tax=Methylomicrobium sp. Wu6 TaxID=3107928 RepID=UPI002DD6B54F|nr:cytochrome c biogenesis heme-transporting ATPase CcmA [Methylomicrobium sp. Wu6]MEC4750230.1 cytochrome c biogenesis heme-transporting ATPase CcmA [Methylomicrobium sp. Wu6]
MTDKSIVLAGVDLSCIRDDRVLFEELNFTLHAGQVLLLEGKNGSGKTSLLRILCGFREADAGQVLWLGEPIDDSRYYADMAYVGHLDGIKKELTVLENLNVSLALGRPGRFSIDEALVRVHLNGYDDVPAQSLSAGQKRRLSLARLLTTGNRLWILDEPFTSLDRAGIALIESLMREHCADGGMIVLTSHHDIDLHDAVVQRIHLS